MVESSWAGGSEEGLVRLGLALYQETVLNGVQYYSVHDLVFDHIQNRVKPTVFQKLFRRGGVDFWGDAQELAKGLAQTSIADHYSRPAEGERFLTDHMLRLTPFGRNLFDLAYAQTLPSDREIDGLSIEDTLLVLRSEEAATALAKDIDNLGPDIDKLGLSNYQRATVDCYITLLTVVARMPDPDAKLFWVILNRLNAFAGVASLIVALIALRMSK